MHVNDRLTIENNCETEKKLQDTGNKIIFIKWSGPHDYHTGVNHALETGMAS